MSGVKTPLLIGMTLERLALNSIRRAILKSINSRENASISRQIRDDLGSKDAALINFHLNMLAKYKIVYKCDNYIRGNGYFYSIYWSDEAQEALRMAEEEN
jgi:hypothetical protein